MNMVILVIYLSGGRKSLLESSPNNSVLESNHEVNAEAPLSSSLLKSPKRVSLTCLLHLMYCKQR